MSLLCIGDELKVAGAQQARWRVVDPVVRDGSIKLFDRESRSDIYESFDTINTKLASDEIVVVRKNAPVISVPSQDDPLLVQRTEHALRCLRIVKEIQLRYGLTWSQAYDEAVGHRRSPPATELPMPSKATLYRYRAAQRSGLPVLRGDKNKGNRKPRYSEQVFNLVENCANLLLLQPYSQWDMASLTSHINDEAVDAGLVPRGHRISKAFVGKVVRQRCSTDPDGDRLHPEERAAARSVGGQRIRIAMPLQRVEQDGLHLPFKVLVDGKVTGKVWLVHAIDCATGMPVGWTMVVGNPTESDGLRCVESILFPKRPAFERLGLAGEIEVDICGTPSVIALDNGAEGKGHRMRMLAELGITLEYCKARHPHLKPFVERLNKSLKTALELLPGCTRHNGRDGARDPVALGDRLMTVQELERWVVRWYYQTYARSELERLARSNFIEGPKLGRTPQSRWADIERLGYPPRPSPSLSEWRKTLYEHHERKLNRKSGITFEGFEYVGPNLKRLISRHGETTVKVLVDPQDYRQVFVCSAEDEPLVSLTERYVDAGSPAFSIAEKKKRQAEEDAHTAPDSAPDNAVAKEVRQRAVESALSASAKSAKKNANRIATRHAREKEAIDRAAKNPLKPKEKDTFVNVNITRGQDDLDLGPIPDLTVVDRLTGERI